MEVLHGDIKITLSDQEAIRGLQRTRAQVKRGLQQISREKAVVEVEANLKHLERDLKQARANLMKLEGMQAEVKLGLRDGNFKQEITRAKAEVKALDGQTIDLKLALQDQRQALAGLKEMNQLEQQRQALIDKHHDTRAKEAILEDRMAAKRSKQLQDEGRMQSQAMAMDARRAADRDKQLRSEARLQQQALDMDRSRTGEVARLQKEYDNVNRALQRMHKTQKPGLFTSPETRMRFDINQRELEGKMLALRARLEAMNAKPIHIEVDIEERRALEKLAGLGNIGTRIGPFSGTLKNFGRAGLILGPILTGLLGSVTALAGAIGAGLTGAVGAGAGALGAFGLSLGGVGALTVSLFRDFKNLNTMQDAYHKQVLKTGANSDKAKVKLQEFNHALGEVTPTTREAFNAVGKLQDRWRGLRKEVSPDFYAALGQAATTANTDFAVFSRGTTQAFRAVSRGFQDWMKGLRSAEAQNIIFRLMDNANRAIPPLMHGLGQIGATLGRVLAQFSNYLPGLITGFDDWATGLSDASQNAEGLSTGVDHLMTSFHQTLNVVTAFSRVIIEMVRASMGPGGDFLQNIADGLNGIADSIHNNPAPLRNFFGDSIATTKALFDTLLPLVKLFMEFSTILRPATTAVLSIITPIAQLVQWFTHLGVVRTALQGFATLWLFKRGTATAVMFLTGAVKDLGNAFKLMNREAAASALPAIARGGGTAGVVRGAEQAAAARGVPAIGTGPAAVAARGAGGGVTYGGRLARLAGVSGESGRVARGMGIVTKGLGALSMGLLGVSAPVAGLGIAAIGAGIAIKKMHDAAVARAQEEDNARRQLGDRNKRLLPDRPNVPNPRVGRMIEMPPTARGSMTPEQWEKLRKAAIAAGQAVADTNRDMTNAYSIQRDLVGVGSQLQNSQLMVEQAEKAYAQAVKHSGKNSLDARLALQQLRDARTQEAQTVKEWSDASTKASDLVRKSLQEAGKAYKAAVGTRLENKMADNLEHARNAAATFEVNLRRAKKGVETFSGEGVDQIGKFLRVYGKIPGVKRTMIQVDSQDAALKLAEVISSLEGVGKRKTVTRILADAKNPKEALRELNAAFDKFAARHPTPRLMADKHDAETKLSDLNKQLSHYGARKPEALLKARDEAQAKLDRVNKQLDTLNGKSATVTAHVKFTLPSSFKTEAAAGGGMGDGPGKTPDIAAAVKSFAEKNPSVLTKMFMGAGGLGSMPAGGSGLNAFNGIATRFGLQIGSGLRPGSITSSGNLSYHAMGRARDFPGPPAAMLAFAKFMAANFGARLKELIHTPLGWGIKDGHRVPLSFWGPRVNAEHFNHVHVAMAQGGKVKPGRYTQPHVLFAEEPGHPEYFISTNPRDRKRSQGLVQQAAAEVGMVEPYAQGGSRAGRIMSSVLKKAPGLSKYNHIYPVTRVGKGGAVLSETVIRGIAEAVGLSPSEALHMYQITRGESTGHPGIVQYDPGDHNIGYGLVQNTPHAWGASALRYLKSLGGISALRNPILNMAMGKFLLRHGGWGQWHGTAHLNLASRAKHSVLGLFRNGKTGGAGGGGSTTKPAPRTLGTKIAPETILANAQARVDAAQGTQGNYLDDIRALLGYNSREKVKVRVPKSRFGNVASGVGSLVGAGRGRNRGNTSTGSGSTASGRGTATNFTTRTVTRDVHHNGLLDVLRTQTGAAKNRLGVVNGLLRGRLTKDQRNSLLQEQTTLTQTIADNRTKIAETKKTAASAQFDRRMRKQGIGSQSDIDYRNAKAASTTGLDDDLAAAQAEQKYYKAREAWAKRRGDVQGATDARTAYNSATDKITSITDEMRQNKFTTDEAWITWSEGQATLTGSLNDDFAEANKALEYWQSRVNEANSRGDVLGALQAGGNVQQYTERVRGLKEDLARLPLERDAALAALTDDVQDDKAAAIALRDYWASRLEAAKQQGDLQGQIDAAGNLKTLNDEIKGAEESIATQMVLLSQARQDLFKNFGSNFLPATDIGSVVGGQAGAAGTVVNLTVNGADLAPDPFTWSHNVAWELQAAV